MALPRFPLRPAWLAAWHDAPRHQFVADVVAGLVVGVVAIPLAVAFSIASGADPRAGLVTVVVAGALAAFFGGSRVNVTGPTGAFVVILAGIAAQFGLAKLAIAVLLAGALLVLAGWFRLGRLIQFIPYPVTTGFTAGIAIVILIGQTQDVLGLSLTGLPPEPIERLGAIAPHIADTQYVAVAIAVAAVVVIQLMRRFVPRVPGPLVALVGLTGLAVALQLDVPTVGDRFGDIPRGFPAPTVPDVSWSVVREMFPSAVTIALLGAIESLLSAVVADGMTGQRHDPDQELVGQGIANMGSVFFGGIAATGAIARTATNVHAGGRTPLAAIVHAGVVAIVLLAAAPLAGLIPMAVLAGILAVVAWNMSERHRLMRLLRMPRTDAGVMVAVLALTVLVDLTVAVTVGLLLAAGVFLHRMSETTRVAAVDPLADDAVTPAHSFSPADVPDGVLVYSIEGPFFFGAADRFQETLSRIAAPPKVLVLRMRNVHYLDATALNALELAVQGLKRSGTRVLLAAIQAQPLDILQRSGFLPQIGDDALHRDTRSALAHARRLLGGPGAPSAAD